MGGLVDLDLECIGLDWIGLFFFFFFFFSSSGFEEVGGWSVGWLVGWLVGGR